MLVRCIVDILRSSTKKNGYANYQKYQNFADQRNENFLTRDFFNL